MIETNRNSAVLAAASLALFAFGCSRERPSYVSLPARISESASQWDGGRFEVLGNRGIGQKLEWPTITGSADNPSAYVWNNVSWGYQIGGILAISDKELPESCSGVRGIWQTIPTRFPRKDCTYVLSIEQWRNEHGQWLDK